MRGRTHSVRFDVDILISRPELLQTIEYCLTLWLPWGAPSLFQHNPAISPGKVFGLLAGSVYEMEAAILVWIQMVFSV